MNLSECKYFGILIIQMSRTRYWYDCLNKFRTVCPTLCCRLNSPAHASRWEQVQKEVHTNGSYQLTETELVFGAKLAWRNSVRCIGRIQWSKLQVSHVYECDGTETGA